MRDDTMSGESTSQGRRGPRPAFEPCYEPYVVEDKHFRALHFDGRCVQSRMRKDAPHELQFGYTRVMMGFLLFQQAPRDILIVGLGGGSLSKCCHHLLPDTRITTVEINPAVIALRDEFAIPPDSDRFRVICADAAEYLTDKTAIADVILLDGYEDYGLPPALGSVSFYQRCHDALRANGVMTANLWGTGKTVRQCMERIRTGFEQRALMARSPTSENIVALAFRQPEVPMWSALQARARALQRQTDIDFPYILDELRGGISGKAQFSGWLPDSP